VVYVLAFTGRHCSDVAAADGHEISLARRLRQTGGRHRVFKMKVPILDHQTQSSPKILKSLSDKDHWYVLIKEQEYGPLRFDHLVQLARQSRLVKDDLVWTPGIDSWIAAGDVSDLFAEYVQSRNEPKQVNPSVGGQNKTRERKPDLKEKAKDQIGNFVLMFLYLWVVFGLLAVHESLVLSQHQIAYQSHGLAVVNALVLAKVMLLAEDLHLGHRLNDKPLIYTTLLKSLLFGITLICFHIVEHILIGVWDRKTIAVTMSEIGADKLGAMVSVGIISTVALVPFFILREISRVIGEGRLWSLFFHPRPK
jgi:hypothetical protein